MLRFASLSSVLSATAALVATLPATAQITGTAAGPEAPGAAPPAAPLTARLAETLAGTALTQPLQEHALGLPVPLHAIQESQESEHAIHGNVFLRATLGSAAGSAGGMLAGGAVLWLSGRGNAGFLGAFARTRIIAGATVGATSAGSQFGRALIVAWLGGYAAAVPAFVASAAAGPVGSLVFFPALGAFMARFAPDPQS